MNRPSAAALDGALGGSHPSASELLRPPPSACRLCSDQYRRRKSRQKLRQYGTLTAHEPRSGEWTTQKGFENPGSLPAENRQFVSSFEDGPAGRVAKKTKHLPRQRANAGAIHMFDDSEDV
jgi:hypothetical protein